MPPTEEFANRSQEDGREPCTHGAPPLHILSLVGISFFLSGLSALGYEIVWQRVLLRLVGSSVSANCAVVGVFMAGLGMGSLLFLLSRRKLERPLRLYGYLELLIGCCGLFSVLICRTSTLTSIDSGLGSIAGFNMNLVQGLRFLSIILLLVAPTMLMGATFPAVSAFAERCGDKTISTINRLYAINCSGAVFGALICGYLLLPSIGISMSLSALAFTNFVAGLIALASDSLHLSLIKKASKEGQSGDQSTPVSAEREDVSQPASESNLPASTDGNGEYRLSATILILFTLIAFFNGAASIGMEIVWTRFLVLFFGSSTHALTTSLAVFISGLSAGAWLSPKLTRRSTGPSSLGLALALISVLLSCVLIQYQQFPNLYLTLFAEVSKWNLGTEVLMPLVRMLSAIWLLFLPSLSIGLIFPLCIAGLGSNPNSGDLRASNAAATIYASSMLGSISGSVLLALTFSSANSLLPSMKSSIEGWTVLIATSYLLLAIVSLLQFVRGRQSGNQLPRMTWIAGLTLSVLSISLLVSRPVWNQALMSSGLAYLDSSALKRTNPERLLDLVKSQGDILFYEEGSNSTITVALNRSSNLLLLMSNGKVEAAIPFNQSYPAPLSDLPTQTLLSVVPSLICTSDKQESLVIGYGSGTTCNALRTLPWVSQVVVAELEELMYKVGRFYEFSRAIDVGSSRSEGSKVTKLVVDARNLLLSSNRKYDSIISQPAEPWIAGAADLYSKEFFSLARARLKDGGVFCQWVQLYSLRPEDVETVIRTFHQSFPKTMIVHPRNAGEILLVGRTASTPLELEMLRKRLSLDETKKLLDSIGIENMNDLLGCIALYPDEVDLFLSPPQKTGVISDDNLSLEYSTRPRHQQQNIDNNIEEILSYLGEALKQRSGLSHRNTSNRMEVLKKRFHPIDSIGADSFAQSLALNYAYRFAGRGIPASDFTWARLSRQKEMVQLQDSSQKAAPANHSISVPETFQAQSFLQLAGRERSMDVSRLIDRLTDVEPTSERNSSLEKEKNRDLLDSLLLIENGEFAQAKEVFQKFSKTNSSSIAADRIVDAALLTGSSKIAQAVCLESLQEYKNHPHTLSSLGLALYQSGDFGEKTIEYLERSLRLNSNQYIARLCLADIFARRQEIDLALNQLNAVSQVVPDALTPRAAIINLLIQVDQLELADMNLTRMRRALGESSILDALEFQIANGRNDPARSQKAAENYLLKTGASLTEDVASEAMGELMRAALFRSEGVRNQ